MDYLEGIILLFILVIGIVYFDDLKIFFKEIIDTLKFDSYEDFINKKK